MGSTLITWRLCDLIRGGSAAGTGSSGRLGRHTKELRSLRAPKIKTDPPATPVPHPSCGVCADYLSFTPDPATLLPELNIVGTIDSNECQGYAQALIQSDAVVARLMWRPNHQRPQAVPRWRNW